MEERGAKGGGRRLLTLMALPCEFTRLILIASTYGNARNLWFRVEDFEKVHEGSKTQLKTSSIKVVSEVSIPSSSVAAYEGIPQVCKQWYAIHKEIFAKLGAVAYVLD